MKFDFCIGNPPYQDETLGDNKGFAPPVYNKFMDAACDIAEKVELIHPARFLFNAGSTPKAWNEKMLNDPHFKVLEYEEDCTQVFSNTDIKGGVAITYHDFNSDFGAIGTFTPNDILNAVLKKVKSHPDYSSFSEAVFTRTAYRLTDKMHEDYPDARYKENDKGENIGCLSKGHDYDMSTNIMDRLPQIFYDEKPRDGFDYIRILGRGNNERGFKWVRREYVNSPVNLDKYKIFLPKANGVGTLGEVLSMPIICEPAIGATETFLSIGFFDDRGEVEAALKYIKTKFARAMLGILKTTQDLTPDKWRYVPLQDFTPQSDIDWSKSIPEIDRQLYKKYGLSKEEIDFIETNVKEME